MKPSDFFPRILRPKRCRWGKPSGIRNDLSRQRYERLRCLEQIYRTSHEANPASDPVVSARWKAFVAARIEADELVKNIDSLSISSPSPFWRFSGWTNHYQGRQQRDRWLREFSHTVHRMHMLLTSAVPLKALESAISLSLFDLKLISSPEAYQIALGGLEDYASGKPVTSGTRDDEQIRSLTLNVINENRRQTLALSQMEVLRDGVTRELVVAASRLILVISLVFIPLIFNHGGSLGSPVMVQGVFLACIGGITGSVISAIVRVGKMLENRDTGRTIILLAGANRSMYFTPFIGCIGAFVIFVMMVNGYLPDVFGFDPKEWGKEWKQDAQNSDFLPPRFLLRALALGLVAGFSERLVHDLIDRFNKPSGKQP